MHGRRFTSISICDSMKAEPHFLTGVCPCAILLAVGDYQGGDYYSQLWVECAHKDVKLDVFRLPTMVNLNWKHWDGDFSGRRFAIASPLVACAVVVEPHRIESRGAGDGEVSWRLAVYGHDVHPHQTMKHV